VTDTNDTTDDETPPGDPIAEYRKATRTNSIRPVDLTDPDDAVVAYRKAKRHW